MSPDWSAKQEPVPYSKLDDPQTLNLYSYVGNLPQLFCLPQRHCGEANIKPTATGVHSTMCQG